MPLSCYIATTELVKLYIWKGKGGLAPAKDMQHLVPAVEEAVDIGQEKLVKHTQLSNSNL